MNDKKTLKIYTGLCSAIALIYGLWMSLFMRWDQYPYIIPTDKDMLLPAEDFVAKFDGMLQQPLYANAAVYWIWVAVSAVILLSYAFFIKKVLFAEKITKGTTVFLYGKSDCRICFYHVVRIFQLPLTIRQYPD